MIYSIGEEPFDNKIKIGFTDRADISERLAELQTGNPRKLICRKLVPGTREEERLLHELFAEDRLCGEWFTYTQQTKKWETLGIKPVQSDIIPSKDNTFGDISKNTRRRIRQLGECP